VCGGNYWHHAIVNEEGAMPGGACNSQVNGAAMFWTVLRGRSFCNGNEYNVTVPSNSNYSTFGFQVFGIGVSMHFWGYTTT